ncbi:unnamed protein product [Schistosoma mattheei]|uniref:Uncharacterized protein n=1 Tax=Schistosoma mattheei TaxID=31246 RepID=A0A3P8E1Y0_9TREM|nr:unnamed protein product [Schistosoma mattheei]
MNQIIHFCIVICSIYRSNCSRCNHRCMSNDCGIRIFYPMIQWLWMDFYLTCNIVFIDCCYIRSRRRS